MPKQKINGRFCHYCTPGRLKKGLTPRRAAHVHEQFPDTKPNRRLYGDLIDDPRNAFPACVECNTSHAGLDLIVWNELEFCRALGIVPRSKTAKAQAMRERNYAK